MRKLKKAVSILLTLVLIGSMFTILSVTSASAAAVEVFARKWVRAENVVGDYYSFTDLYQNFIICRCNPHFDETNYDVDDPGNVYNRTEDMSLTDHNEIRLFDWNNGQGKLNYYWSDNSSEAGNGKIYLSTNGDNINFNTDGVLWYAYTWETFTVEEVAATSPTYSNGVYSNGLSEHYESGDRYFVKTDGTTDGNQNVEQVSPAQIKIPYFEYEYLDENETIRLKKCNSDDAEITVPDEIPSQYYPSDAPEGTKCTIIGEGAFAEKNNLTAVTIGDNVNHIAGNTDAGAGAFFKCGNLQSVTIGSSFNYAGQDCFLRCNNLTDFTTTSMERFPNQAYFSGLQDLSNATIHCYHTSGIASLCNDLDVTFDYLDEPPATHTYHASYWDWDNFDTDHTVKALVSCSVCSKEFGEMDATIEEVNLSDADALVLPGGMPGTLNLQADETLAAALKKAAGTGIWICAICAAPRVLGHLGLLDGQTATCYPGCESYLTGAVTTENPVEVSGQFITSRGVGTAIPFALKIIEKLEGAECAQKIEKSIVFG